MINVRQILKMCYSGDIGLMNDYSNKLTLLMSGLWFEVPIKLWEVAQPVEST